MPSIPIQNITDLAAGSVTGNETVPVVQQLGSNYYTYKTPIKNFFYNNAIPFRALSSCPLKWTSSGILSATGSVTIGNPAPSLFSVIGAQPLTIYGNNPLFICTSDPRIRSFAIGGTISAPTAVTGNQELASFVGYGFNGSSFNGRGDSGIAGIYMRSKGVQTTSNSGGLIVFRTSLSGTYNSGKERMRIDHNGYVGIGTSNPRTELDVNGTITLNQNSTDSYSQQLRFTDASGTFPKFFMGPDNSFIFYGTNATGADREVYRVIQRSDTSSFMFQVPVTTSQSIQIARGQALRWGANNESTDDANIQVNQEGSDITRMRFRLGGGNTETNDTWIFEKGDGVGGDGTNILTIQTDGNVGIGVQSPNDATSPLNIKTTSVGADPSTNGVFVQNRGTTSTCDATLAVQVNGANSGDPKVSWDIGGVIGWSAGIDNSDGDKFKIANNWNDLTNKTRMVIGATGNTSFLVDGFTEAMVAKPPTWAGGVSTWDVYATGSVGAGPAGSNPRAYLNNAGTVAGITFNSSSSIRFKKDIEPLKDSLANIQKLRGVRYNWKETEKADIGLIAEEVNEVYPEIVKKDDDGVPEGIDYGKLTAVLIETVKELTQKIEELERKVK